MLLTLPSGEANSIDGEGRVLRNRPALAMHAKWENQTNSATATLLLAVTVFRLRTAILFVTKF